MIGYGVVARGTQAYPSGQEWSEGMAPFLLRWGSNACGRQPAQLRTDMAGSQPEGARDLRRRNRPARAGKVCENGPLPRH
jgi:hypothetical protein